MEISIYDHLIGLTIDDPETLMKDAGLDPRMGFSGIGMDDECLPIVFDKCGNYGYLDCNIYRIQIDVPCAK